MQHLREALDGTEAGSKQNKLVHRVHSLEFPFRMVKNGFFTWESVTNSFTTRCSRSRAQKGSQQLVAFGQSLTGIMRNR
jgi:hypothetical protein